MHTRGSSMRHCTRSMRAVVSSCWSSGRRMRPNGRRLSTDWSAPRRLESLALHRQFGFERLAIAKDRRDGELLLAGHEANRAIALGWISFDEDAIPTLGVPDVVDAHVVMRAPEKRNGVEPFRGAKYVARGRLSLALRDDPVFDADLRARVRI